MLTHTGGRARPRALAAKMAGALVKFMKTGDPNGGGLPPWPKYTQANGEAMILDDIYIFLLRETTQPHALERRTQ